MGRHLLLSGAAAAVCLVAVGCSGPADARVIERDGVTTMVIAGAPEDGGEDALIAGTLTVTENGCVAVVTQADDYVLAWPPGTELTTDDGVPAIHVPDVGTIGVGEELSAGGGYHQPPGSSRMPEIPDRCVASEDDEIAIITDPSTIDL